MTELNPAHPLVQEALPGFTGHVFVFYPPQQELGEPYDNGYEDEDFEDEDDNRGNLIAPGERRV